MHTEKNTIDAKYVQWDCKINHHSKIYCISVNKHCSRRKLITFKTSSKIINCLGINVTKEVHDL